MEVLFNSPVELIEIDVSIGSRTVAIVDAHDIPFANNTFDCVIAQAMLEHVADPYRCVKDIYRVLKAGGCVYAETAFMQQVHGGAYDFTRFTHAGHRRLFKPFQEIESGAVCGTGMALAWTYEHFLMSLTNSTTIGKIARIFARFTEKFGIRTKMSRKIAYILGSFAGGNPPFIINEIKGLQKENVDIVVFPVHKRALSGRDANTDGIKAIYADPMFSPRVIAAHFYYFFRKPGTYLKLLLRNKVFGGKKIFWEGVYYARVIKQMGIRHIHAHFVWNAADCARLINRLTNIPFSVSVHANDIYCATERLEEKLTEAEFIITCVRNNKTYIGEKFGQLIEQKIHAIYHGVDMERFTPRVMAKQDIDILSIANLVEKKGHRYLIEACGLLKNEGVRFKCSIIGEGPQKNELLSMIKERELVEYVQILNEYRHEELLPVYSKSKIFVLPSVITNNGDRDGIPNVLAEAMAMGLTVISTDLPNITELIENNKNGRLVADKNPRGLADAIEEILSNEDLRSRLGEEARIKIISDFDAKKHVQKIANLFVQIAKERDK